MKHRLFAFVVLATILVPTIGQAQATYPLCDPSQPIQPVPCMVSPFATLNVVPDNKPAEPRVTMDVGYIGGAFQRTLSFPPVTGLQKGDKYLSDGLDVMAKVRITDVIGVNIRSEHTWLRSGKTFTDFRVPGVKGRITESDFGFHGGEQNYRELSANIRIPLIKHSLIAGLAQAEVVREWQWKTPEGTHGQRQKDSSIGLVYGVSGQQKVREVTLDYSARRRDRVARKINEAPNDTLDSSGCELRATAAWMINPRGGILGGVYFRRLNTEASGSWPSTENQDILRVVLGARLLLF